MKTKTIILSLASVLALSSCVSKKEFVALQANYDSLRSEYASTQKDFQDTKASLIECQAGAKAVGVMLEEQKKANADLKAGYQGMKNSLDQSLAQSAQGSVNIAKLVDEINASNRYIQRLVDAKSKSDSLNVVLTNNLTRSLSREELKEVDVKVLKGVVYVSLADNMLFKSGSYEVNDRAMETLSKIAKILKDYKDYDILVEGNTDNVPISRTNIRNNWDLSALRASSIVQALQTHFGINPQRMTVGGRGEFNPLTDNDSEVGKQRNRRTEIIITPKLDEFMDLIEQTPDSEKK